MVYRVTFVLVLAGLAAPALSESALERDMNMNMKTRPIMKVVGMLEDMKAELTKEMEDDKAVYETLMCWCTTGKQDKKKAIEMSNANIDRLSSEMYGHTGQIQELKTKRKETQ